METQKKYLLLIFVLLIFSLLLFYQFKTRKTAQIEQKNIPSTVVNIETTSTKHMGFVTGKLCYPSESIPKGTIVAKNTLTNVLYTKEYAGSSYEDPNIYTFELSEGVYYLKYAAKPDPNSEIIINGYYTEQCSTGNEKTCAQENKRTNKTVTVKYNETISGVDLCDFYYAQNDEPKF